MSKKPNIRFPEFNQNWVEKKIDDICFMQAGKFIQASKISENLESIFFPCYGGNGLRGYTSTFNYEGKYTLIGRQGALCGNVTLVKNKFYATEHAIVVSLKPNFDTDYTYYLLGLLNLNQYATGQAQPGLSVHNLKEIKTIVSNSLPEQTKISSFLTSTDEKLQALKKKLSLLEKYKKGVMQQIFSQEIRFKNDEGNKYTDWEKQNLGDVLIKNSKKNKNQEFKLVQSVSNTRGFVNQTDYFEDRIIASKDLSNYYVIQKGNFAYNPSRIDIGSLAYKNDDEISVISPLYISFSSNKNYLVDQFLLNWFSVQEFTRQMNSSFEGSVRNTLSFESLSRMTISFPSVEEQIKIANFLSSIDIKINHCKLQLLKMEVWKKGLLQQMFC